MSEIEWADKDDGDGVYESHNLGRGSAFWIERDRYGHKHNRAGFRLHCGDSYLGDWRDTLEETKALAQSIEDLLTGESPRSMTLADWIAFDHAGEAIHSCPRCGFDGCADTYNFCPSCGHALSESLRPLSDPLQKLVDEQAEDEMLWFVTENITEAYLQQELRRLHAAIESRGPLSDEPREHENQTGAAPSVGEETNREWRERQPWPPKYISAWLKGQGVNTDLLVIELRSWADAWENESTAPAPSVGELENRPALREESK